MMKKTTTILLTALFGLIGLGANAQTADNKPCQGSCPAQNAGDMNKMRQPREFTEFAFEGILLDINQQTRIDSLNAAVKANAPAPADCKKADCKKTDCKKTDCRKTDCKKADCKKGNKECKDSVQCPKKDKAAKSEMKHKKGNPAMRGQAPSPFGPEYIAKVKEILTPEQYTVFLENIVEVQGPRGAGMGTRGPKADGKGHTGHGPKAQKMPKSAKARPAQGQK